MEIQRSFEISELNWGVLPDLPSRLQRLGVTVERCSISLSKYVGCQGNWTLLRPRKPKRLGVVEAPSEG